MGVPVWIHILTSGDIWVGDTSDLPAGTILSTFKVQPAQALRKIGSIAGTAGSNLTSSGHNGRNSDTEK